MSIVLSPSSGVLAAEMLEDAAYKAAMGNVIDIYGYKVSPETNRWLMWYDKMSALWKETPNIPNLTMEQLYSMTDKEKELAKLLFG